MKGDHDGLGLSADFMTNVLPCLIPDVRKENWQIASGSRNNFELSLSYNFTDGTQYDPKSKRFVHFTSLGALQSIVNEKTIRMYDLCNANDPKEYGYFPDGILNEFVLSKIKSNTYILSLCDVDILEDNHNILNLWRLYGNQGWGVAIEFEIDFQLMSSTRDYFLGKIIYEKPDFEKFMQENEAFNERNDITIDLKELLRVPLCFHKSPYYVVEKEVRLMTFDVSSKTDDINSRNEVVTFHQLELGNIESKNRQPSIAIKRIQLGFRHSDEYFKNVFKSRFSRAFGRLKLNGMWNDELPILEHSPLQNIYR